MNTGSRENKVCKNDLVQEIMTRHNLEREESKAVVDTIFNYMKSELSAGTSMEFRGFGTFIVKKRKARVGHNAKTNEFIRIPPQKIVVFKAGKELKEYLKQKK